MARVDQVEHRSHAGGGGCGRDHQDGAGRAARCAAQDPARGRADASGGLVGGERTVADGVRGVAGNG